MSSATADEEKAKIKQFLDRLEKMHTPASIEHGLTFKPRPSDVFVVSYPKTGTTWMQCITHGLRTGGSLDFEEIAEVIPWTVCALDCGSNLNDDQVANPRIFKTHESHDKIAKGGKYIYMCRDPMDVLVSFHKFVTDYVDMKGEITMEQFASHVFLGSGTNSGTFWDHLVGWYPHFGDPNVLVVFFEDMKENLPAVVRQVAKFMEVPLDAALEEVVVRQASKEFMLAHSTQYDGHFVHDKLKGAMGLPPTAKLTVGKVRKDGGKVGSYKEELTSDLQSRVAARWTKVAAGPVEASTFQQLRQKVSFLLGNEQRAQA